MHVAHKPATVTTATPLEEGGKMDAPDLDIWKATNSVHSDLFYGMYETLCWWTRHSKSHLHILLLIKVFIFKLGPLFLMTMYKTKHITCCINCKGIQHHISEHVYKEYLIIVTTYVIFLRVTLNIFQKLHVLKFTLQLTSLSSTTFSPNYFPTCLKQCSKIPPMPSSELIMTKKLCILKSFKFTE
jgi:hypothetical protein